MNMSVVEGTKLIKVLLADFGEAKQLTQTMTRVVGTIAGSRFLWGALQQQSACFTTLANGHLDVTRRRRPQVPVPFEPAS